MTHPTELLWTGKTKCCHPVGLEVVDHGSHELNQVADRASVSSSHSSKHRLSSDDGEGDRKSADFDNFPQAPSGLDGCTGFELYRVAFLRLFFARSVILLLLLLYKQLFCPRYVEGFIQVDREV